MAEDVAGAGVEVMQFNAGGGKERRIEGIEIVARLGKELAERLAVGR